MPEKIQLLRTDGTDHPSFTGERFVPGQAGARIAYEHLHRYVFARRWVEDRRVLDVGCGLGYGADLLATRAAAVVALDCSLECIRQARGTRANSASRFLVGAGTELPFSSGTFDVVVAFEIMEHLARQSDLLAEVRRVLTPRGTLIVSSPDRDVYSGELGHNNEFHVKELTTEEFRELLSPHFECVDLYGQRVITGSLLRQLQHSSTSNRTDLIFGRLQQEPPALELGTRHAGFVYNVAVCGPSDGAATLPAQALLVDVDENLVSEQEDRYKQTVADWQEHTTQIIGAKDAHIEEVIRAKDRHLQKVIREKDAYLSQVIRTKDELIHGLEASAREWETYAQQAISSKATELDEVVRKKDAHLAEVMARADEELKASKERIHQLEDDSRRAQAIVTAKNDLITALEQRADDLRAGLQYYEQDAVVRSYTRLKHLGLRMKRRLTGQLP